MRHHWLVDALGWAGAAALLLAYGLVSTKRVTGDAVSYQALNLVGGVCVLGNSFYYGAMPSAAVNAVWIAIALLALGRRVLERRPAA
jgi:hypothetical protein